MNYTIKNVSTKQELIKTMNFFRMIFKGNQCVDNPVFSLEEMEKSMQKNSKYMLYAEEDNEVIGIAFGGVGQDKTFGLNILGVKENYRKCGLARTMVISLEKLAKQDGFNHIELGALQSAEGFYYKMGYTGSLLIQSQCHSIEQLLTFKTDYKVKYTNMYQNYVSQVCLEVDKPDRDLQKEYEKTFPGCYTQMIFEKNI